ncbi:MAG TPA: WYL domain-containing protein [Vicinamibacterales bacterium]|nr:WYL domain-containing protein [Vicinamibacterales bacterium]
MPRNAELIRQWEILRTLDACRYGVTIDQLARERGVSTRTIRRDLEALALAGFPVDSEKVDGTTRWKLRSRAFRSLDEAGFSVVELGALYFSRSLLVALAGTPFRQDLERTLAKLEAVLPERVKTYLDRLRLVVTAKTAPRKRQDERQVRELVARLLEASLHCRRVAMRYHSLSSGRTKRYIVEPYRLVYALGGLYLWAYVAEYGEMRTFAIERIRGAEQLDERFEPRPAAGAEPFAHSLGVHTGPPERVEIEFDPRIADYIREREWHSSQRLEDRPNGAVRLTLEVSLDNTLKSWILGFGPLARVVAPRSLVDEIVEKLEEARELYAPPASLDWASLRIDPSILPPLPF